jgi:hypothetical protein
LRIHTTGRHGDAGLLTVGDDFFKTKRAIAENSDKRDKHFDLRLIGEYPVRLLYAGFVPSSDLRDHISSSRDPALALV